MLFPPREALTTAEPPEPFTFQHSDFIIYKQNIQEFVGPAGRHFGVFSVFRGLFIRVQSCPLVVLNKYFNNHLIVFLLQTMDQFWQDVFEIHAVPMFRRRV